MEKIIKKKKTGKKTRASIREWAAEDRPYEKLLSKGPQSLSDSELLAILLLTGTQRFSAVELARQVLWLGQNNINELAKASICELTQINGIGRSKAVRILAALELGRRRQAASLIDQPVVRDSKTAAIFLQARIADFKHEVFGVLSLDSAGKIKNFELASQGGITATIADPRVILKKAIAADAVSIIICHNHPSGNLQPSRADEELTVKIREGASYLDMRLLDHIIVGERGYFSFADSGILKNPIPGPPALLL